MCTIYHSLNNIERAVDIKSIFNLTDLSLRSVMTISLPKADRKNLCWRVETITLVWCLNVKKGVFLWLQSVHKKITTENASSCHLVDLLTCFCSMPQQQHFSHITVVCWPNHTVPGPQTASCWNRKYTGKTKVLNICVFFDKISIVSSQTRETLWINTW